MDKHRYSEAYILNFNLIRTDKKRVALYKFLQWILIIVIVLFVVSAILTFIPIEKLDGKTMRAIVSLTRSGCLLAYVVIKLIAGSKMKAGSLYMNDKHFIIKEDGVKEDFMLDKINKMDVRTNEDGYYKGFWKKFIMGIWYPMLNPEGKGNFMEFDYENMHYVFEINLKSFSEQMLFERRVNEWIKNYKNISKPVGIIG